MGGGRGVVTCKKVLFITLYLEAGFFSRDEQVSLANSIRNIGLWLKPDLIVGCRYCFGMSIDGRPVVIEGIIMANLESPDATVRYLVSNTSDFKFDIIGLVKTGDAWLLQVVAGETFVLGLEGNFSLVW